MNWFKRIFRTRTDTPGVSLRLSPGHSRSVLAMFIATALLLMGAHSAGAATNYTAAAATFSWVALLLGVFALIYNDEFNRDLFNAGGHDDGDQYRALQGQKSRWLSYQLKLQSFSPSWMDKKGDCKEYKSRYRKYDAQRDREFKKEFTCQSHSKDSLRKVSKITGHEFASSVVKNIFHMAKVYRVRQGSSNGFLINKGQIR